jgi:hypothetical protein
MAHAGVRHEVVAMTAGRFMILLGIVLDALLLAAWLSVLWLFDRLTVMIPNGGHLEWDVAKTILGSGTLAIILLFLFWDIRGSFCTFRGQYRQLAGESWSGVAKPDGKERGERVGND